MLYCSPIKLNPTTARALFLCASAALTACDALAPSARETSEKQLFGGSPIAAFDPAAPVQRYTTRRLRKHFERVYRMRKAQFESFMNKEHSGITFGIEGEIPLRSLRRSNQCLATPTPGCDGSLATLYHEIIRPPHVSLSKWASMSPQQRAAAIFARYGPEWAGKGKLASQDPIFAGLIAGQDQDEAELRALPKQSLRSLIELRDALRARFQRHISIQYHVVFDAANPMVQRQAEDVVTLWLNADEFMGLMVMSSSVNYARSILTDFEINRNIAPGSAVLAERATRHVSSGGAPWSLGYWETKYQAVGFRVNAYRRKNEDEEFDKSLVGYELRTFVGHEFDEAAIWALAVMTKFVVDVHSGATTPRVKFGIDGEAYRLQRGSADARVHVGGNINTVSHLPHVLFEKRAELKSSSTSIQQARCQYLARLSAFPPDVQVKAKEHERRDLINPIFVLQIRELARPLMDWSRASGIVHRL